MIMIMNKLLFVFKDMIMIIKAEIFWAVVDVFQAASSAWKYMGKKLMVNRKLLCDQLSRITPSTEIIHHSLMHDQYYELIHV